MIWGNKPSDPAAFADFYLHFLIILIIFVLEMHGRRAVSRGNGFRITVGSTEPRTLEHVSFLRKIFRKLYDFLQHFESHGNLMQYNKTKELLMIN